MKKPNKIKLLPAVLTALLMLLLLAVPAAFAVNEGEEEEEEVTPQVGRIVISRPDPEYLNPPDMPVPNATMLQATATLLDVYHTVTQDVTLRWYVSSGDASIVKVPTGAQPRGQCKVEAAGSKPGVVSVSARANDDGGVIADDEVTLEVSGVALDKTSLTLDSGKTASLVPTCYGYARALGATMTWNSENESVAKVDDSGNIVGGSKAGTTTIRCVVVGIGPQNQRWTYVATCTVTTHTAVAETITRTLADGQLSFDDIRSELYNNCYVATGRNLVYLSGLTVPAAQGTLYYNYTSASDTGAGVASGGRYYYSAGAGQYSLRSITFVPKPDFYGTAVIYYSGYEGSGVFSGEIHIKVNQGNEILYESDHGEPIYFSAEDFSNCCEYVNKRPLSYVTFTLPSSRYGYLYRNYYGGEIYGTNVSETDKFFRDGTPSLDRLAFVPAEGYSGTFSISFRGYDTTGATFRGSVTVQVATTSGVGTGDVNYTTSPGRRVTFTTNKFNNVCDDILDVTLDYIRFTDLPESSRGTLYYDTDGGVSISTRYYRSGSGSTKLISKLSFLPESRYSGTVNIPFTGYGTNGNTFEGTVSIVVEEGRGGTVNYTVNTGGRVYFSGEDFSETSYSATNRQLNYIRFDSLPSSNRGVLYYQSSTKVTTSTSYYYSGSSRRLIEDLNFVAADSFTGTVTIPFTGYNTYGTAFDGTVEINVKKTTTTWIYTHTTSGGALYLDPLEFSTVINTSKDTPAAMVTSVRFDLPDSRAGTLYSSYISPMRCTKLSPYQNIGINALSQVAFVPKAGYNGTVYIPYTATDVLGVTHTDTLCIQVTPNTWSAYFSDMGSSAWAAQSVDFLRQNGIVQGTSSGNYSPAASMTRGAFILMLDRAFGFPDSGTSSYPDVPRTSVYAGAIAGAKALGIVTGDGKGNFRPRETITRQDAGLYLYRCLLQHGKVPSAAPLSVLTSFADYNDVAPGARDAMAVLVQAGVFNGNGGYLLPGERLNRAQMAAILHRALT